MASWINPDRGELFFARKTVLVEGETERSALPYLASRIGCLDSQVSLVDCGSKHNVPLYMKVLNAFALPYVVVHDEDPIPDPVPPEWTEDKLKSMKQTFSLNAVIAALLAKDVGEVCVCEPDFEGLAGVSHSQGEKKGKALAALDHLSGVPKEDIPGKLTVLVKKAYE